MAFHFHFKRERGKFNGIENALLERICNEWEVNVMELGEEEVKSLLAQPSRSIREATDEEVLLIRRELKNSITLYHEEKDIKESEMLNDYLEKMQIQVIEETEAQIHFVYTYQFNSDSFELNNSGWFVVEKIGE